MGIEGLDNLKEEGYPAGPVSMGEGRKREPRIVDGKVVNGTIYLGCSKSPDGLHHFTAKSCVQSVETFVCDYCPDYFYD